ncbi:MAG: hypothetical protein D6741_18420 [Planctomycetota bacterium]|nr:MAG: hypothetical protein D6741_18420 [Planctomycetota bacterium]
MNAEQRWQKTARQLIKQYGQITSDGRQLVHPQPHYRRELEPEYGTIYRYQFQFITPENWGFAPELKGCPWRGRLGSWDEAREAAPPRKPKRRLRPWGRSRHFDDV